jgi:hypothetical protein
VIGRLTLITSIKPATLGKHYSLEGGSLKKTTAGELVRGSFEVVTFSNIEELGAILAGVRTNQAIMASLPIKEAA